MAFDSKKKDFDRDHIFVVEIDQKACSLTYGSAPCTASGSGDAKCYNTLATCQDVANYDETTRTYRFCESRSPHPFGIDAISSVQNVNITPSELEVNKALGKRSSATVTFLDHPDGDDIADDYLADRTFDPLEVGTYWTKFRARNPYYENQPMRIMSGYLDENSKYDSDNFETRHYTISEVDINNGRCVVKAKDPLARVTEKKPLAPTPSSGVLNAAITAGATSATLSPTGIGNSEYAASGKVRIEGEICSFTRSGDVLTLTRAQNNTVAVAHAIDSTVQQCLEYSSVQVDAVLEDLLLNYAEIPASYLNTDQWASEVDVYLSTFVNALITDPTSVYSLIEELGTQKPHSLYWDEQLNKINLVAVKEPPSAVDVIDMDSIIEGSFSVRDRKDLQISTIFARFGQIDPTKNLDEPGNYSQTYARVNSDAISRYNSNKTMVVNSRWISSTSKVTAQQLAATWGRRFGFILREVSFSVDAKDSLKLGQTIAVEHQDIVDFNGYQTPLTCQVTLLAAKKNRYDVKALEYVYDADDINDELDLEAGVDLVRIAESAENINLRTLYNVDYPAPTASTVAKFIIERGVVIGSSETGTEALATGSWPSGATVILVLQAGAFVVGAGGEGGTGTGASAEGGQGGLAISLNYSMTLENNGVIGGGGGGGGASTNTNGCGGAGSLPGPRGDATSVSFGYLGRQTIVPADGTLELGGTSYLCTSGGDLGQDGADGDVDIGGAAGDAIDTNSPSNILTQTVSGDIRGNII